jgi:hypothetical protein
MLSAVSCGTLKKDFSKSEGTVVQYCIPTNSIQQCDVRRALTQTHGSNFTHFITDEF